jgi:hypothetical protein
VNVAVDQAGRHCRPLRINETIRCVDVAVLLFPIVDLKRPLQQGKTVGAFSKIACPDSYDRSSWSGMKRARSSINSPAIENRHDARRLPPPGRMMSPKELDTMKELAAAGRQGRIVLAANRSGLTRMIDKGCVKKTPSWCPWGSVRDHPSRATSACRRDEPCINAASRRPGRSDELRQLHSPRRRRVCWSCSSSAMLLSERRTSSSNGARGRLPKLHYAWPTLWIITERSMITLGGTDRFLRL